jgi:hypothetical protein
MTTRHSLEDDKQQVREILVIVAQQHTCMDGQPHA